MVLFVILLGMRYVNLGKLGARLADVRAHGFFGHRGRRGLHIFCLYRIRRGFNYGAGSQESAARPADRHHRFAAGVHDSLHPGRGGAHRDGALDVGINIEAPLAVAFLDRGLTKASYLITAGALAGLTSVMLVMLLGQTRVLYSMANDGLLPRKFFAAVHPKFRTPYKNTILVGLLAAIVGSLTPIDDIGKMVNIGTLLAFVIVCIAVLVLRKTNPGQPRPFRTPWVPSFQCWESFSMAT